MNNVRSRWFRLQVRARRIFIKIPLRESQRIYILVLLIGVACGLAAVSFHMLIDFFQQRIIYRAASVTQWWAIPLVILIPGLGGLIAGAGLYFLAPEARGSGIPQVKQAFYLNRGRIFGRVIPYKMFLSAFNIGTGASLGREGPTVQICAGIASLLGRIFVISRRRLRTLLPIGAAAGIAAAFNTPIAAVTFTIEEILGDTAAKPLGSIVIAAVIAAVVERSVLGEHPLFIVPHYKLHFASELLFYAFLGLLAGLTAVGFNQGLLRIRAFFRNQRSLPQWATPGAGGLIVGVIGAIALLSTGSSSIFGVGYGELASELKHSLPFWTLLILGAAKLCATILSYGSGSSGGIFGPSLYLGGMLGGAVGILTRVALGNSDIQPEAFALVGMGAVFAGVVRAPVTSIIIIFELTDNYSIILPLMVANMTSYVLARKLDPVPIYDALLLQDGIHLPQSRREVLKHIPVRRAMTRNVATVRCDLTVDEAFHFVQRLPQHHHAYPVMSPANELVGICTFNDLKRAIADGKSDSALADISAKRLVVSHPDDSLDSVILTLGKEGVSQLPVVPRNDPRKLLGIITAHDVAESLSKEDARPDP